MTVQNRYGTGNSKSVRQRPYPRRHAVAAPQLRRRREERRSRRNPLLLFALGMLGLLLLGILTAAGGATIAYAQVTRDLRPRLVALQNYDPFQTTRIYARDGTLLFEIFGEGRREPVSLEGVSRDLINATIAIEDASFYENSGVDYAGITRAVFQNVTNRSVVSGASTISQQVIKNIVLTPEERAYDQRFKRKVKEMILAQELSGVYSKDEILELYLNEIPYGNLAYGIQAAAKNYFGVDASDLSLAQAALLAGLPQSPTYLNPIEYLGQDLRLPGVRVRTDWLDPLYTPDGDLTPPKLRQISVLRQMVREGYISEQEGRRAAAEELIFANQDVSLLAPHFVFHVKEYLEQKYGPRMVSDGGLRVYTTIDLELQRMAQEEAQRRIAELEAEKRNIHNAAVVVLQPNTGQILAMVGSVGYTRTLETTTPEYEGNVLDGKVNVTTRQRQPGSALKPFAYLAGYEQNIRSGGQGLNPGITPGTLLLDLETKFENGTREGYRPENFDTKWHGPMRARMALANSLNMPAVKALRRAGIPNMIDLLYRAGVAPTSLSFGAGFYGLALTLGGGEVTPLDLATAYNTLASGGRYFPPTPILKVTDSSGNVLEEFKPVPVPARLGQLSQDTSQCRPPSAEEYLEGARVPAGTQCIDPRLAFIITNMMSDNEARAPMFGRSTVINLTPPAAVKTGTTDDFRDAWASGFTPYATITVWTGNNNNEPTARVESTTGGGVIWARLMQRMREHERLMVLLSEPFGGAAPQAFPAEFPGVFARRVCGVPGPFSGPGVELFTEDMQPIKENYERDKEYEEVLDWSWEFGSTEQLSLEEIQACSR